MWGGDWGGQDEGWWGSGEGSEDGKGGERSGESGEGGEDGGGHIEGALP